jgi:hypothetical protein
MRAVFIHEEEIGGGYNPCVAIRKIIYAFSAMLLLAMAHIIQVKKDVLIVMLNYVRMVQSLMRGNLRKG